MRRKPAVAGQFYHAASAKLDYQVQQYTINNLPREDAIGVLSPHAGLIYSGAVAGEVYSRIVSPDTFLLIGPNHTGIGSNMAIMSGGDWEIPTAVLRVDERLARKVISNAPSVSDDMQAHLFEHSIEVQLPFIASLSRSAKIVPLTIMSATFDECRLLGEAIAKSIKEVSSRVVIVASSDMSHYISDSAARKKDKLAIDKMLSMDAEGLFSIVKKEQITMCGYLPATVMLVAARSLGAREARLIRYTTSGEISGDYDHVVGYAGIIVS